MFSHLRLFIRLTNEILEKIEKLRYKAAIGTVRKVMESIK